MASLMIHLLVGHEYCKTHNIKDVESFLKGNIDPDMVKDKKLTHYSKNCRNKTYTESVLNKINLQAFCKSNNIDSDYMKGHFLHLITDYVFFNKYLINSPKYKTIENIDQLEIEKRLYRDYYRVNHWILSSHNNLLTKLVPEEFTKEREDYASLEVLDQEKLEKLIYYCSNIDLEQIYKDITSKANTPDLAI